MSNIVKILFDKKNFFDRISEVVTYGTKQA